MESVVCGVTSSPFSTSRLGVQLLELLSQRPIGHSALRACASSSSAVDLPESDTFGDVIASAPALSSARDRPKAAHLEFTAPDCSTWCGVCTKPSIVSDDTFLARMARLAGLLSHHLIVPMLRCT